VVWLRFGEVVTICTTHVTMKLLYISPKTLNYESYVAGMNTYRSLTSGLASFRGSGYYMYHPRYHETTLHFPQNVELRVLCSWNEYVPESYK